MFQLSSAVFLGFTEEGIVSLSVLGSLPLKQSAFSIQSFLVFKAYIQFKTGWGLLLLFRLKDAILEPSGNLLVTHQCEYHLRKPKEFSFRFFLIQIGNFKSLLLIRSI